MIDTDRIMAMRAEVIAEGALNASGGPNCGQMAEGMAVEFGWQELYGSFYADDGSVYDDDHAYAFMPDGTIVDPTIDQFKALGVVDSWPGVGPIAIVPRGHPFRRHYDEIRPRTKAVG